MADELNRHASKLTSKAALGFSLIEAAIVLGVVGLVIGGIWIGASAVRDNMRANAFLSLQGRILDDIQGNYKNETLDMIGTRFFTYLKAKGLYQSSDVKSGIVFYAPELGTAAYIEYTYYPAGYSGYGYDGVQVRIWNIQKSMCRRVFGKMLPFFKEFTHMSVVWTPQVMADDIVTSCESSGFVNYRYTNMLP